MSKILTENEVRELLYNKYKETNKTLTPKEIVDKGICGKGTLKRVFAKEVKMDKDVIWQDIAKFYKIHIPTQLEEDKTDLIERLKEVAKVEGEPVNSKFHRDLYCKGCKVFGSWRELCMQAGIKVNNIKTATLENDTYRKDEIIEKLLLLFKINKTIPSKALLGRSKNIPSAETIEKLYKLSWKEVIDKLEFDLRNENKYRYVNNKDMISKVNNILEDKCIKTLYEYSFNIDDGIAWIYVFNKFAISWEWFNVLKRNEFNNCNSKDFKYSKEELLNILSFKYILLGRRLSSTEINNDIYLPNAINIMNLFDKNIYEVWKDAENNLKYKL
jgi:hypothetical protein